MTEHVPHDDRESLFCADWVLPVSAPPLRRRRRPRQRAADRRGGPGLRSAAGPPRRRRRGLRPGDHHARLRQLPQPPRVHHLPGRAGRRGVRRLDHPPGGRQGGAHAGRVPSERPAGRAGVRRLRHHHDRRHHLQRRHLAAAAQAGLRGRVYLEVFGIDDARLDETLADLRRRFQSAQAAAPPQIEIGISPHAPYTVSSRLFQAIAALAAELGSRSLSHVAESREELTYIRSGSGKFAHDFREKMGWERMLVQPYGVSPIKYLQQWGVLNHDFLAVTVSTPHATTSASSRPKTPPSPTARRATPSSAAAWRRWPTCSTQGVRVGFGTDSPASSNIMDMFDEMRTALFLHRAIERDVSVLDAQQCVAIATLGAAEALGMAARSARSSPASAPTSSLSTFPARTSPRSTIPTRRWCTAPIRTTCSDVHRRPRVYRDRVPLTLDAGAHPRPGLRGARKLQTASAKGRPWAPPNPAGGISRNRSHPRSSKEKACSSIADASSTGRSGSSPSWPSSWSPS